jgi:hypothetical protein
MTKPLSFDLLARDTFRPADRGWLTPTGVVRADAYVPATHEHLMAVRSIGHVESGTRGLFVEASREIESLMGQP